MTKGRKALFEYFSSFFDERVHQLFIKQLEEYFLPEVTVPNSIPCSLVKENIRLLECLPPILYQTNGSDMVGHGIAPIRRSIIATILRIAPWVRNLPWMRRMAVSSPGSCNIELVPWNSSGDRYGWEHQST